MVLLTGVFAANLLGRSLLEHWERILGRIPLVRSIYNSVKQVSDTVLAPMAGRFARPLLIQYRAPARGPSPSLDWHAQRRGGLVPSRRTPQRLRAHHAQPDVRLFLMMPRDQVIDLQMSVDAALKYIVSMGVVAPADRRPVSRPRRLVRPLAPGAEP